MSNDWMGKLNKFGNELAAGIQDTGRLMKSDFEKARGQVQERSAATEAARAAAEQLRWERKSSPTWAAPTQAADTTEWATYELVDPRSSQVAVTFRHPADWQAGGSVRWPTGAGLPVTYAVGSSPSDQSCVAERFPRIDLVSGGGPFDAADPARERVGTGPMPTILAETVVPRLRPGAFVVFVDAVDPGLYLSQPVDPRLMGQGYLVALEYDRIGVPWADELLVLRYQLPASSGPTEPTRFGVAVWSLNARREVFPAVRSTLRGIALSAASLRPWDEYVSAQTGWPVLV